MLDSNLIIYAAKPEYPGLRRWVSAHSPAVSAVSVVEVLGYHKLTAAERTHFEAFFAACEVISDHFRSDCKGGRAQAGEEAVTR